MLFRRKHVPLLCHSPTINSGASLVAMPTTVKKRKGEKKKKKALCTWATLKETVLYHFNGPSDYWQMIKAHRLLSDRGATLKKTECANMDLFLQLCSKYYNCRFNIIVPRWNGEWASLCTYCKWQYKSSSWIILNHVLEYTNVWCRCAVFEIPLFAYVRFIRLDYSTVQRK